MATKPGPFPLTFTLAASSISAIVYCETPEITVNIKDVTRQEWLNSKINQAMDRTTFAKPIIQTTAVNSVVQVGIESCGFSNVVPLGPEDANLPNVLQRQVITEYKFTGAPSSPSAVQSLFAVAQDHRRRLDQFEAYLATLEQNISYQELLELRALNFSYLTNTGLSVSGIDVNLSGTALISEYSRGLVHFTPSTSTARTMNWGITIQVITFESRVGAY